MDKISIKELATAEYQKAQMYQALLRIENQINKGADGYLFPVQAVTTTYQASTNDCLITGDATGAAFTVTLPLAADAKEKLLIIKKIDASGNAVTVDGSASETIDGAATYALSSQWASVKLMSNGSQWLIV